MIGWAVRNDKEGYRAINSESDLSADEFFSKTEPAASKIAPAVLIANARYQHEVAGTTVAGVKVFTDRDTQNKLTAAALRASRDSTYGVDWKLSDGTFVNLTAVEIIAVADGVGDYVQACYTREAVLLAELADGEFNESMLTEGWP